jgi:RNA polymerase sigma-70 factor (ECF subfamily)
MPVVEMDSTHVNREHNRMTLLDTRVSVILGVCQHEPDRWREFDAIYRPMLLAYVHKRGLNESDANDVVQEIFLRLLGKIHTYDRSKCRFRAWLFLVTHNALIDRARRKAAEDRAMEGWAAQMLQATSQDSVVMEREFQKLHREKILAHALRDVRARVPAGAWTCFVERLLKNRPSAAIADELNIKPGDVYVRACRVMKKVRQVCKEFDEDISHAFELDAPGRP